MATRLFSLEVGTEATADGGVTEGAGAAMQTSDAIEFQVDLAAAVSKSDVLIALARFHKFFMESETLFT